MNAINATLKSAINNPDANLSERLGNTKEQLTNAVKTNLKTTGATLAIGAGTVAAVKSKSANKVVSSLMSKVANSKTFKELAPKATELIKTATTKFKNLPGSAKVIAAAGTALAAIAAYQISNDGAYKSGEINQKYTDKIELRKKLEN